MRDGLFDQTLRLRKNDGGEYANWDIKKLGDITYKVDRKNKNREVLPIYSISNINGFIPQSEQFEGIDSNERGYDISLYKIVERETFAYNPARINVGSIGYSENLKRVLVSSLYVCFKTMDSIDDRFFNHFLQTERFNNSVLKKGEGGVRIYLFYENFSEIEVAIPSYEEQIHLATILTAMDQKIKVEKQILKKYQEQKKSLLGQLFI
jgi:type I restriction enzyme S subunit